MTLKERIKNFLPNMEKGIKRFPITIIFSVAIFILSVYLIEIEAKMKMVIRYKYLISKLVS